MKFILRVLHLSPLPSTGRRGKISKSFIRIHYNRKLQIFRLRVEGQIKSYNPNVIANDLIIYPTVRIFGTMKYLGLLHPPSIRLHQ